jgi:class 3 adenylate cyclase
MWSGRKARRWKVESSNAGSARIDPEDLREVISGYQKCVAETVQRFRGFVAKYMGDGVLVYFGYPTLRDLFIHGH